MTWFMTSLPWGLLALAFLDRAMLKREILQAEKERDKLHDEFMKCQKERLADLEEYTKNIRAMNIQLDRINTRERTSCPHVEFYLPRGD
jgi:uncharacterized coiled-coil DUF342 family protein